MKKGDVVFQDQREFDWDSLWFITVEREGTVTGKFWPFVKVSWKRWSRRMGGGLDTWEEIHFVWNVRMEPRR